nr:hypothetical protein CFP56_74794 [Quercus suber]
MLKLQKKSLLPLQDPWYCFSPLFPIVPIDIGASDAPFQWIIRGEAPNLEIAWVPSASRVMDFASPAERASTFTSAILVSQQID